MTAACRNSLAMAATSPSATGMRFFTTEADCRRGRGASLSGRADGRVGSRQASAGHAQPTWETGPPRFEPEETLGPAPGRLLPRSVALAGAPLQPHQHAPTTSIVAEARFGDAGRSGYSDQLGFGDNRQPRIMFDPDQVGLPGAGLGRCGRQVIGLRRHLLSDRGARRSRSIRTQDWQEGDTIPRRLLRPDQGSRADIAVSGQAPLGGRLLGRHPDAGAGHRHSARRQDPRSQGHVSRRLRRPPQCHRRSLALRVTAVHAGAGPRGRDHGAAVSRASRPRGTRTGPR
jgi:hypothetical protein